MQSDLLFFFQAHPKALPLYKALEKQILQRIDGVAVQVQKSQISFYRRHLFACVSFLRLRKKKDCPENYIVLTFGLNRRLDSPRVEAVTEPYPRRFTHHMFLCCIEDIDAEVMGWLEEAAGFAAVK